MTRLHDIALMFVLGEFLDLGLTLVWGFWGTGVEQELLEQGVLEEIALADF